MGCDFAGDIVELGKNAQDLGFKVGDPVAGFTRGGALDSANGTFQGAPLISPITYFLLTSMTLEYVKANPKLVSLFDIDSQRVTDYDVVDLACAHGCAFVRRRGRDGRNLTVHCGPRPVSSPQTAQALGAHQGAIPGSSPRKPLKPMHPLSLLFHRLLFGQVRPQSESSRSASPSCLDCVWPRQ